MKELIGSLMTYEVNLAKKLQEGEEEKQSEEDDDLVLITRKLIHEK